MLDNAWLPNWENEEEYPAPDDLSLRFWAWEFLRRNPDYQADIDRMPLEFFEVFRKNFIDWSNICKMDKNHQNLFIRSLNSFSIIFLVQKFNLLFYLYYDEDIFYEVLHSDYYETISNNHAVNTLDHYKNSYPFVIFGSEYDIKRLTIDPNALSDPDFDSNENKLECGHGYLYFTPYSPKFSYRNRKKIKVTFDLTLPIEEQFAVAKDHVESFVNKIDEWENYKNIKLRSRVDRDKFPLYIRVLDGRTSGATFKEIADIVVPNMKGQDKEYKIKNIDNYYQAAVKIRDCGYYSIAAMEVL